MIYNVPIERLPERYSDDWFGWFHLAFHKANVPFETIYPEPLSNEIKQGAFLDAIVTNHFKAQQLVEICEWFYENKVMPGDTFLFHDGWFPGVEMLAYMRNMLKIDFQICAIFHAGTYDIWDRTARSGMTKWASNLEDSWFKLYDKIFVATNYHKELICKKRYADELKIFVTGLPFYRRKDWKENPKKENIIVFPHRLDEEKQPELFDKLKKDLADEFPQWRWIKSKDICQTKDEYYQLLRKSKIAVSFAMQETWGIAMQEAVMAGCVPLVPNRLSYPEVINDRSFRYDTEITDKAKEYMTMCSRDNDVYLNKEVMSRVKALQHDIIYKGKEAIPNMLNIMGY